MFDLDLNVPLIMTLLFSVKGNYSTVFYGVTSLKANSAKIVFAGVILNFESSFFLTVRKIYQNKDLPWIRSFPYKDRIFCRENPYSGIISTV